MKSASALATILAVSCFLIISQPAMAYLDPGTGSMILQFLVAGILGALFAIKTCWRQICTFTKGVLNRGK
jgi:hypothetical protein